MAQAVGQGEWATRLRAWRANASNTGGPGSESFLAGHPEGTPDQNEHLDLLALR